jgi:DNA-binding LacI/PurR family transcriptional regulator
MQSNRVAGIILMATTITDIKKSSLENCSVPLVITGQNFDGINCVYHDDFNAMRELTELFIRKGGKRFVYIGAPESDPAAGRARREGAQEALRRAGFDAEGLPIRTADFDSRGGYMAMQELLEKSLPKEVEDSIRDIVAEDNEMSELHNLRTRRVGNVISIEMHLRMPGDTTLTEAHRHTMLLEQRLRQRFGTDTLINIHLEPLKINGKYPV